MKSFNYFFAIVGTILFALLVVLGVTGTVGFLCGVPVTPLFWRLLVADVGWLLVCLIGVIATSEPDPYL